MEMLTESETALLSAVETLTEFDVATDVAPDTFR